MDKGQLAKIHIHVENTGLHSVTNNLIIYFFKKYKNSTYICENNLNKSGAVKVKAQNYCNKVRQIGSYLNVAKEG